MKYAHSLISTMLCLSLGAHLTACKTPQQAQEPLSQSTCKSNEVPQVSKENKVTCVAAPTHLSGLFTIKIKGSASLQKWMAEHPKSCFDQLGLVRTDLMGPANLTTAEGEQRSSSELILSKDREPIPFPSFNLDYEDIFQGVEFTDDSIRVGLISVDMKFIGNDTPSLASLKMNVNHTELGSTISILLKAPDASAAASDTCPALTAEITGATVTEKTGFLKDLSPA